MPMPPHSPTDKDRRTVEAMIAYGITQEQVAAVIGVDKKTLIKYYREELDTAKAKAVAAVAEMLYQQCKKGNTTAMIFYLKTQGRWNERVEVDHQGVQSVSLVWAKPVQDDPDAD